jgi:hypothetical protein
MNAYRWIPLALTLACSPALAGAPIDQSRPLAADATVSVRNVAGEVNISAWGRDQIQITGTLGEGARGLDIEGDAHTLSIRVQGPKKSGWFNWGNDSRMDPSVLNIHLPAGVSLTVKTVSAPINVRGLKGGTLVLTSVSGRVHVEASGTTLHANSVSGNIDVQGHFDDSHLETVSGDILVPMLGSTVSLQTVSGDMRAAGGPFRKMSVSTVSGDVELNGDVSTDGVIDIDSMSGDVRLDMPTSLSARIRASTFSGSIRSDVGSVRTKKHGPGASLDTQAGSGQGRIHVETFSGDLRIHRQP